MARVNWNQFGLKRNPYDTSPLEEGGDVNVRNAFIGREKENQIIEDIFASEERACLTICGDAGIGKTSIANYQKYLWKYKKEQKSLFSFRGEIEADENLLNKKNFILEIIGSVIREIELVDPKLLEKHKFLQKMRQMIDITQTLGISGNIGTGIPGIFELGASFSERQLHTPLHITTIALENSFNQLLTFIRENKIAKRQHHGLIIHVNNFDYVMEHHKKETIQFFAEIRDFLQTPNVYFLFLGPNNFFKEIIAKQTRVKSIFIQYPVSLEPLTKSELVSACNKRLNLLRLENVTKVVKPFEDGVIASFYDIFQGDIRMIMTALRDSLVQISDSFSKTLTLDEAVVLLGRERMAHVEQQLTEDKLKVLDVIVQSKEPITQVAIAKILNKQQTNISSYFKKLADLGIIEVKREEGRHKFWHLTAEYLPLIHVSMAQERLQQLFKK